VQENTKNRRFLEGALLRSRSLSLPPLNTGKIMAEMLEIYDLKGKLLGTQARDIFYKENKEEYKKTGKVTRQVKTIRLLLMTSAGRVYIQKRSHNKKENAGLYDKTIGGHVPAGYPFDMTLIQETHQELGLPLVVLSKDEFDMASENTDLTIIGIVKKIGHINNFPSVRRTNDGEFVQPYLANFYVGYYDGGIRFCDGETTGLEVFNLDQLEEQLEKEPDKFTDDLKFMIKKFKKYLVPLKR